MLIFQQFPILGSKFDRMFEDDYFSDAYDLGWGTTYMKVLPGKVTGKDRRQDLLFKAGGGGQLKITKAMKEKKYGFCTCGEDTTLRRYAQHNRSKICPVCEKLLPGGIFMGKDKELFITSERLRLMDAGIWHFLLSKS